MVKATRSVLRRVQRSNPLFLSDNDKKSLRTFAKINKVPTETQVSEYFSRFNVIQYFEMANSILATFFKPHSSKLDEYIVDATPVACDINIIKQFITDAHLKKLGLKWGYSTTKKVSLDIKSLLF